MHTFYHVSSLIASHFDGERHVCWCKAVEMFNAIMDVNLFKHWNEYIYIYIYIYIFTNFTLLKDVTNIAWPQREEIQLLYDKLIV